MPDDPKPVIVEARPCPACPTVRVMIAHHRDFPEIPGEGETAERAADRLLRHLTAALDGVGSARHRAMVERALDDVRAYLAAHEASESARPGPPPGA